MSPARAVGLVDLDNDFVFFLGKAAPLKVRVQFVLVSGLNLFWGEERKVEDKGDLGPVLSVDAHKVEELLVVLSASELLHPGLLFLLLILQETLRSEFLRIKLHQKATSRGRDLRESLFTRRAFQT